MSLHLNPSTYSVETNDITLAFSLRSLTSPNSNCAFKFCCIYANGATEFSNYVALSRSNWGRNSTTYTQGTLAENDIQSWNIFAVHNKGYKDVNMSLINLNTKLVLFVSRNSVQDSKNFFCKGVASYVIPTKEPKIMPLGSSPLQHLAQAQLSGATMKLKIKPNCSETVHSRNTNFKFLWPTLHRRGGS